MRVWALLLPFYFLVECRLLFVRQGELHQIQRIVEKKEVGEKDLVLVSQQAVSGGIFFLEGRRLDATRFLISGFDVGSK